MKISDIDKLMRRITKIFSLLTGFFLIVVSTGLSVSKSHGAILDYFRAGNIISDSKFFTHNTMSVEQIQEFLNVQGQNCESKGNNICLKDYQEVTYDVAANNNCLVLYGAAGAKESAAQIIWKVAQACNISEKVLLVTLQKEQGLITTSKPPFVDPGSNRGKDDSRYRTAMGYGCPDGAACDADYFGFWNQVYLAAWQFNQYTKGNFNYKPNQINAIKFNPDATCGKSDVYIENWATAALYIYTPYQPNQAALAAGYGTGDYCSSYGNRNMFLFYNEWFGTSHAYNFNDIDQLSVDRGIDVRWLADYRVTTGCNPKQDKFCPSNPVNRGSMAQFLMRMTGEHEGTASTSSFADVNLNDQKIQYAGSDHTTNVPQLNPQRIYAINWLVEHGITVGSGSNTEGQITFRPWDPVNRGSMAQFLMRSAGVKDPILYDPTLTDPTIIQPEQVIVVTPTPSETPSPIPTPTPTPTPTPSPSESPSTSSSADPSPSVDPTLSPSPSPAPTYEPPPPTPEPAPAPSVSIIPAVVDLSLLQPQNIYGYWYQPIPTSLYPDVSTAPVSLTYANAKKATVVTEISLDRIYAINWLAQNGITIGSGTTDQGQTTFRPWDPVNRGSMAQFLHRMRLKTLL